MMNIGIRPTVDGQKKVIEVNIFDFDQDVYGKSINISFLKRIRSEQKFGSLDALKAQIANDKVTSLLFIESFRN